ncbi:MAG TPA: hypothetical protein VJT49_29000 [Amycolatopsis sp.]|nr:hypothetical protein [Amycolatopsis sp.]
MPGGRVPPAPQPGPAETTVRIRRPQAPSDPQPGNRPRPGKKRPAPGPTEAERRPEPAAGAVLSGSSAPRPRPGASPQTPSKGSDGTVATGHHRAVGTAAGRRRIAKWPIVTGVLVLLLGLGMLGWGWANNVLDSRTEAQAKACTEGDSTMKVVVAPGAVQPVSAAAAKWNEAKTVVHSYCVRIDVQSFASDHVYSALTGQNPDAIGGIPAAWIPEAGNWGDRLAAARPDLIGSPAEKLTAGYTYIGLGGSAVDEVAVRAAQVFRDFLMQPAQQSAFSPTGT